MGGISAALWGALRSTAGFFTESFTESGSGGSARVPHPGQVVRHRQTERTVERTDDLFFSSVSDLALKAGRFQPAKLPQKSAIRCAMFVQ